MAIKTKDEILSQIRDKFAEDSSDEVIGIIEDISDTITDLESKANGDGKDWEAEAKRIDNEWREKYKARFFSGKKEDEVEPEDEVDDTIKNYNFEDLFTKE
ncbi:MAG: hypothetical protein J6S67_01545 [Methanobrevibacter sp.]|nr:hypothetical protein [Methanobrevibacter sp.]